MRRAFFKRISRSRSFQTLVGSTGANYLRLVWRTSRVVLDPPDLYTLIEPELPFILAMWHGQHFMAPFLRLGDNPKHRAKVLISRHRDAEINAIAAERLGIGTIRGSGDQGLEFGRKGGVGAFVAMLEALKEGFTVAMTADVPKVARVAGGGIVRLSAMSQRPIVPVAVATSRRIELNTWDRAALNLPFGCLAVTGGPLIQVPQDPDPATLEHYRVEVEQVLNVATKRAYVLADGAAR
jgi:lysophospholipid acyltransferase (LPLAT)-like uncharacterized protein